MTSDRVFTFNNEFNKGKSGEDLFQVYYPGAVKADGRIYDFTLDKKTVEIKSDYWNPRVYSNFFIETISNDQRGTLGGPYRAYNDKVDYFVYFFVQTKEFYWFKTNTLIKSLEPIINKYPLKIIKNKGYNTEGRLVAIKDLAGVYFKMDTFV